MISSQSQLRLHDIETAPLAIIDKFDNRHLYSFHYLLTDKRSNDYTRQLSQRLRGNFNRTSVSLTHFTFRYSEFPNPSN